MDKLIHTGVTMGSQPARAHRRDLNRVRPVTSAELIGDGVRPEFLEFLALRRAAGEGVTRFGDHYFARGFRTPSWLAGVFEELVSTGLLALAEEESGGLRRARLTAAGRRRYDQLSATFRQLRR